jgi:hypothetical protein
MQNEARASVVEVPGAKFTFLPEPPKRRKPTPPGANWDLHKAVDRARESVHMNGVTVFALGFFYWCYSIRSAIKQRRTDYAFFPFSLLLVVHTLGVWAARANNKTVSDDTIVWHSTLYIRGVIVLHVLIIGNFIAAFILNPEENGFRAFCVGSALLWFSVGVKTHNLILFWGTLAREKAGIGEPLEEEEEGFTTAVDQYGFRQFSE